MKYRIQTFDGRYYPGVRRFLRWKPLLDKMNYPSSFVTEYMARVFITRNHINYLNNTEHRRILWGRTLTPKIKT